MTKTQRVKRRCIAEVLLAGHNALHSLRIMTINEIVRKFEDELTPLECRLLLQRSNRMATMTNDVRRIAHKIERGDYL